MVTQTTWPYPEPMSTLSEVSLPHRGPRALLFAAWIVCALPLIVSFFGAVASAFLAAAAPDTAASFLIPAAVTMALIVGGVLATVASGRAGRLASAWGWAVLATALLALATWPLVGSLLRMGWN